MKKLNISILAKKKFKCPECGSKRDLASWISRASVALEEVKPSTELSCFDCLADVPAVQVVSV